VADTYTYDLATDPGRVRLLLNDIPTGEGDTAAAVFSDAEIQAFLDLEGGSVKRAAAQAIDSNATNEALASKVLRTQDLTTDGAKLADAMRKHADSLRAQADRDEATADADDGAFTLVSPVRRSCRPPELTEWPAPGYSPYA